MASLSDYYREIRPLVKNVPDVALDYALNRSLRHFCRESWCYEKTVDLQEASGQQFYPIKLDTDDEVIAVIAVERDQKPLRPSRPQDRNHSTDGTPASFIFEPPNILAVHPVPDVDEDKSYKVRLVLQPKESATTVPDIVDRLYKPYIVYGALAYLKEFEYENSYDPSMAMEYARRYEAGIFEAKGQRARGYMANNLSIRPRSFL